jgi:hypothetical protein
MFGARTNGVARIKQRNDRQEEYGYLLGNRDSQAKGGGCQCSLMLVMGACYTVMYCMEELFGESDSLAAEPGKTRKRMQAIHRRSA